MSKRMLRLVGALVAATLTLTAVASSAGAAAYPNDLDYVRQWGLRRIGAPEAWKTTKGKGVVVAVVDTGVNYRHEDLKANVLKSQYDAINKDNDALDLHGHGTGVAGVIAAVTNNRMGIAGVAPDAKIMAVRAFGSGDMFNPAEAADGIMWAADHGANVINLSIGESIQLTGTKPTPLPVDIDPTDLFEASLLYATAKGALVVAAAGNDAGPLCSTPAFNVAVLCVGATDSLDRLASFSNYFLRLDVVAPGKGIYTTGGYTTIGYSSINGTSFASPHVAGVGALLMSMGASNALAALIIRASAKDLGLPGYDNTYGFGRVDAKAAVDMCKQIC